MSKANKNQQKLVTGFVKRHPDGFGFLIPDDSEVPDIYIPRPEMTGLMGNDRVEARVIREPGGDRWRGEIKKILARAVKRVTGKLEMKFIGNCWLRDHSHSWGGDVRVINPRGLALKDETYISAQITSYPDSPEGLTAEAVALLGDIQDPLNDSVRMLHVHNIPFEFSKRALQEAEKLSEHVTEADMRGRKDLRAMSFITIDGKTAKDFDDAICVQNENSGFHIWVAIADVSHYVKPKSAIDDDAYERGTSTYFPNFVSPMLPEKLSNELCSLKPKVPRLAFVAEMSIDFTGELTSSKFYEAVIMSQARVTYGEAQEVIEGRVVTELNHVSEMIKRASDAAKILMSKRFKDGSLDLEIPETEIEVDDTGQPVDILQTERLFAHRLIEELMLLANIAVAREFTKKSVPGLYRIHEEPNPQAMEALSKFLEMLGSKKKLSGGGLQKKITRALQDFQGHAQEHILHVLTLRSMAQAQYSAENVGHFGLGFSDYSHFTSPIRRYPDLIVHRQLKALLKIGNGYQLQSQGDLQAAGTFLSACEQRSVKAERQIKSIKKARFMSTHVGEEFTGLVSSVTKFGVFVILRQFDVDGLVRIETLPGDRFEFDEKNMRLVGRKSGHAIVVGDIMQIVVAAANIDDGRIDFVPAGVDIKAAAQAGREKPSAHQNRGATKTKSFEKRRSPEKNSKRFRSKRFSSGRRKG